MSRDTIKSVLAQTELGASSTVAGWVRTRRDSKGGFSFLELNDGSCFANLQIVVDAELPNYRCDVMHLFPGSAVQVRGVLVASSGAKQAVEMHAAELHVFGHCEPSAYPLQKQRVSFERLRELAHLRPRTNTFGAITRVRNALAMATHTFFQDRDFYYVNTPIITGSDCEGAGEMFRVTTLDMETPPRLADGKVDHSQDFFGVPTSLTVSGQLEAEAYACALGRVYTFGPTFRAENSNTSRHLAEFWMVEPEMAFATLAEDAELAAEYLRYVLVWALERCSDDLEFFTARVDRTLLDRLQSVASTSFEHLTYSEAVALLQASGETFTFPVVWGEDLQSEHERFLTERALGKPLVVTDYPRGIKAFYMRLNDDERTVAAMDVLLPKVGEIIGGSQREERHDVLVARIREAGLDPADYWWYLDLRRFGSVPHAGFGLGFERLVQFVTGTANIRDVIPFPRTPKNAAF